MVVWDSPDIVCGVANVFLVQAGADTGALIDYVNKFMMQQPKVLLLFSAQSVQSLRGDAGGFPASQCFAPLFCYATLIPQKRVRVLLEMSLVMCGPTRGDVPR